MYHLVQQILSEYNKCHEMGVDVAVELLNENCVASLC